MMEKNQKEIAIVSQYFFPDYAATGNLMTDLAIGLVKKGFDVKVFSGYPSYWGIKQKTQSIENYDGVTINRVFHFRLDTRKKYGSMLLAISFFIFLLPKLLCSSEKRLYFFVTTPPFLPFCGYLLKKIRKQPYIVIIHDIYPEIAIKIRYTQEGFITKIWEKCNKLIYNNADRIIVLGGCMEQVMKQKFPNNSEKIRVIQNWEHENFIKPLIKSENKFSIANNLLEKFVITYSGNMGVNHNLEIVIEAATYLKNSDVEFLLFGEGSQKNNLVIKSKESGLQNVKFFDFQPISNFPYTMTCGDAIVVSQEKGTEGLCVSSKFYTALAAGKPIIAIIGDNSEISNVIKTFNCGIVISNNDAEELAKKISELSADKNLCQEYGKNARVAFEQNFTYEIAMKKYFDVVKEIEYKS
jgi:glycosyltransferase involved in cell wall biosynthesis